MTCTKSDRRGVVRRNDFKFLLIDTLFMVSPSERWKMLARSVAAISFSFNTKQLLKL